MSPPRSASRLRWSPLWLIACGGGTDLARPEPPPPWPIKNLVAPEIEAVAHKIPTASPMHNDSRPPSPPSPVTPWTLTFADHQPDAVELICGSSTMPAVSIVDGVVRVPGPAGGCQARVSAGGKDISYVLDTVDAGVTPVTLTCSSSPTPRCAAPPRPAAPSTEDAAIEPPSPPTASEAAPPEGPAPEP